MASKKARKSLDQGNLACSVFLDFVKAFDTVDYHILLQNVKTLA